MECQQTATGTSRHVLQLPDDDLESTSADLVLKDDDDPELSLRIGELIRRERHADVYSVYWCLNDYGIRSLEARAFVLDGVPGKLKRHRKRCIQRLEHRTISKVSCRGAEVIVCKINCNNWMVPAAEKDKDSNETRPRVLVPTGKTSYKREAARMRQRERRRAKADQEHSSEAELVTDDTSLSEDVADNFRATVLLYIFFDKKGHERLAKALYVPGSCRRSPQAMNLYSLLFVNASPPTELGGRHLSLNADKWTRHGILQHFKDLEAHLSNMSYRQLFTGVHYVLSTLSPSDLRSVPSSNHQFDLLQHIQTTLPILIENFQNRTQGRVSNEYLEALLSN